MTLRLSVESDAWRAHVQSVVAAFGDVLPVVKGNGYGFGRAALMTHTARIARDVAVGTVHELTDVPLSLRPFVLTPIGVGVTLAPRSDAVLTIASEHDLGQLARLGATNPVVIKVASSMQRYGVAASDALSLLKRTEQAGHTVVAWSVHLPLAGSDREHADEVIAVAKHLNAGLPIQVSHVGTEIARLRHVLSQPVMVRSGTQLWLGDKSMLGLQADVIATRNDAMSSGGASSTRGASGTAGYRATPVSSGTMLAMVGCGSSHGVGPLDDGRSPFHFDQQRLEMFELPHMHTTMLQLPGNSSLSVGAWVDVQQPLTRVWPDVVEWR